MRILRLASLVVAVTFAALAQTTLGTILGEATDSSGAVLPDVAIVVRNMATGIEHRTGTGASGLYQVTNLPPGRYTITASHAGFRTYVMSDVTLETSATVRANVVLTLGELATQVTVEAAAPLINTESAEVANVRSSRLILEAPVNYRGDSTSGYYASLLHLTPGAQRAQGSNFSLAGARGRQYGTTVDGTKIESFSAQGAMDSTAELRIQLANDKAEALRPGGMYASSKSGGNELHGALFYYYGSSRLRARDPFSLSVPFREDSDYGASIGGPIAKNRTFFHSTYDRFPMKRETVLNANVPTIAMRRGDFSALLPGRILRDPLTNQPFANNIIPANRLNQIGRASCRGRV